MSADFAVISCNGRMTSDPKSFDVGTTKKVVFSIAVNRYFKKKDAKPNDKPEKHTTFIDCVAWGATGERVAKFGRKGAKIALSGDWESDTYSKKDSKEIVKRTHINVSNLSIFTEASDEVASSQPSGDEDNIPF